jgi:hypothetical protein
MLLLVCGAHFVDVNDAFLLDAWEIISLTKQ